MSSKINVIDIVRGHLCTFCDADSQKVSLYDIFTFFIVPLGVVGVCLFFRFSLTDSITSLLVNFGAIFTALLLSVLVLVYDQGSKIDNKVEALKDAKKHIAPAFGTRKKLLNQLYYNICYAILLSISLVVFCVLESVSRGHVIEIEKFDSFVIDLSAWLLMPIVIFISLHLVLTILMIIKRMHTLLTTE
ncbi:hypothetical protein MA615_004494 [Vibrio vulnificus]|uniref:hypothetical protein n=1 Tax=Vibrio vulnificus TaxID=672 RepID=UPI0005440997|nr:hypothetical protein [Vibrio vulnificus]EGQ8093075.1 hypothetical protein [Vibrio vulnificus]EHH0745740.1 hypothetical protein [Vibrio vulnificus]EHU4927330.1 hypothetical protein [Vibrio vulnificus]EID4339535.1 hypothetical protein [Vibrio vulnificus]EIO4057838.1 hypothetical protein [Vibrio vulnificus]